jgi:predicted ATP-dependent endonuclease of OLD family
MRVEGGIYYTHLPAIWRAILSLAQENETQLFVSTHSRECLEALVEATKGDVGDIQIWRTERNGGEHKVRRFDGEDFKAGIEYGEEIR